VLLNQRQPDTAGEIVSRTATDASVVVEADLSTGAPAATPAPNIAADAPRAIGSLSYTTRVQAGDTVLLAVDQLPPTSGSAQQYVAWLQNTEDGDTVRLGALTVDPRGSGVLTFTGETSLATEYNRVFITRESGDAETPGGEPMFAGEIPVSVVQALYAILIASPDGIPTGAAASSSADDENADEYEAVTPTGSSLLDSALTEARIANQHAGLASRATNVGGLTTHAEHTINILRGTQDDLNGNGRGENPGRGFGVGVFLDRIEAALTAADQTDLRVQNQIELIRVCINNARAWMDEVLELEAQFVAAESLEAVAELLPRSTDAANALIDGIDVNANGAVEPYEGECGLTQIREFGISVANLDLFPTS